MYLSFQLFYDWKYLHVYQDLINTHPHSGHDCVLAIFICVIKLKSVYYFGNVVAQWLDLKVCVLNSFIITIHVTSHIHVQAV